MSGIEMDIQQVVNGLKKIAADTTAAQQAAMMKAMERVREVADQWVPEDTGDLRGSWKLNTPVVEGDTVKGTIEYTAEHAAFVHEMPKVGTNWTRAGSDPKWLERAIDQTGPEAAKIMSREMSDFLATGKAPAAPSEKKGPTAK